MTALLAKSGHAAATGTSWPEAVVLVAICALLGFTLWLITR